jgi:hypothetical protein
MGGPHPYLRRRSTITLVALAVLLLIVSVSLVVNPSGGNRATAENSLVNQSCVRAGECSSATGSTTPSLSAINNGTPTPSHAATATPTAAATHSATATATATHSATATPTHAPTATPTHTPTSTSAPPAAGYFALKPVGSWSSLPSDGQCAAQVHYSTWEPRPENAQQNNTKPAAGAMAAAFAARPRNQGGTYNPLWDSWLLKRVDGQFTGTTDEIFQWSACKWGLPDNVIRAVAVQESTWFEYLHYPTDAAYGGGGGGSCYWDYGCGDAFSSASSASTVYCNSIATLGLLSSEIHNYQKDPKTTAGGYPWTPGPGLCPKTFSILGVMSWEDPAWEAPYPPYAGNQNGTFPFTRDSTAAAADYFGAYIRGCYEGWETWLKEPAGDLWGCVGSWYSGDWHSSAANGYISRVQNSLNTHIWLTADFDDSRGQYSCDPKYGCAS